MIRKTKCIQCEETIYHSKQGKLKYCNKCKLLRKKEHQARMYLLRNTSQFQYKKWQDRHKALLETRTDLPLQEALLKYPLFFIEELIQRLNSPCSFCGQKSNSIDRINPNLFYTKENIQSICITCSLMKHTKTSEEFISHLEQITIYLGQHV